MKKRVLSVLAIATALLVAASACSKDDNDATGAGGGNSAVGNGALVTGKKVSRMVHKTIHIQWENGVETSRDTSNNKEYICHWNGDRLEKMTFSATNRQSDGFLIPTYSNGHITKALMRTLDAYDENAIDTIVFRYDDQGRLSDFTSAHWGHGYDPERGEYYDLNYSHYGYTYDAEGHPHKYSLHDDGSRYDWGYTWTGGNLTAYDEYGCEYDNKVNYWRCALPWELLLVWSEKEISQNNVTRSFRIRSNGEHTNFTDYTYQYSGDYPVSYCMRKNNVFDGNGTQVIEYVYIEYTDGTGCLN